MITYISSAITLKSIKILLIYSAIIFIIDVIIIFKLKYLIDAK